MAKQPADPHIGIGRPANRRTTRPGGVDLHCEILLIDDHPDVIGNPRHTRELRIAAHAWLPGGEGTGIRAGDLIWAWASAHPPTIRRGTASCTTSPGPGRWRAPYNCWCRSAAWRSDCPRRRKERPMPTERAVAGTDTPRSFVRLQGRCARCGDAFCVILPHGWGCIRYCRRLSWQRTSGNGVGGPRSRRMGGAFARAHPRRRIALVGPSRCIASRERRVGPFPRPSATLATGAVTGPREAA